MQRPKPHALQRKQSSASAPAEMSNATMPGLQPPTFQLKATGRPVQMHPDPDSKHSQESPALMGAALGNAAEKVNASPKPKTEEEAPAPLDYAQIKAICDTIPTGVEAIKRKEDYNIGVEFIAGGGSYYDSAGGKMIIDANESAGDAALTFIHEMHHAYYDKEGLGANVVDLSRDEYVAGMVKEEAEGTVKSIEGKIELEATDFDTSGVGFPLETEYRTAYKTAYDAAIAGKKSEEEAKADARKAGMERVIKGFMDGEVVTSNSGESYPDYYGNYWDTVHPDGK